jgi:hypothetical protein
MKPGNRIGSLGAIVVGFSLSAIAASAGCVSVNGGAVEVAWMIFARDGRAITDCACADPAIAYVRLNLVSDSDPDSQPCAGLDSCRFSCGRQVGATPFMIAPGQYLMSLVPIGSDGVDLPSGSVESPAPESRSVVLGQPTELEAFMLKANCASRCNSSDVNLPCAGG